VRAATPVDADLDAVELMLAAAAASTPDELALVRMAVLRSRHLLTPVSGRPSPDEPAAGVVLLGGLLHAGDATQPLAARIGRISRRPPTVLEEDQ